MAVKMVSETLEDAENCFNAVKISISAAGVFGTPSCRIVPIPDCPANATYAAAIKEVLMAASVKKRRDIPDESILTIKT